MPGGTQSPMYSPGADSQRKRSLVRGVAALGATGLALLMGLGTALEADATVTPAAVLRSPSGVSNFGQGLAVSGDTIFAGAPKTRSGGQGFVFTNGTGGWTKDEGKISPAVGKRAWFGKSVGLSGTSAVVGAPYATFNGNSGAGVAYIYDQNDTGRWVEEAELTATDGASDDNFGYSVAISGSTALVGALEHDSGAGAVYVFTDETSGWTQTGELSVSGTEGFGGAVAVDGSTALVAGGEYQGAFVFTDGTTGWTESANLCGCDPASVAISGSTVVMGQDIGPNLPGPKHAWVYTDGPGGWSQTQLLTASKYNRGFFGASVAVSGSNIIVGSPHNDGQGDGAAYVFSDGPDGWSQEAKLSGVQGFGDTVALDGTTAAISNPGQGTAGFVKVYNIA
jgi:FG-GAP repeat